MATTVPQEKPGRTPMGEFIVPTGGKPLTSLGDCNPAPSDYSPRVGLTKPAAPHYSIAGPYKTTKAEFHVSPADHDTTPNLTWRNRKISIKGKGKMRPYDVRDDAHVNDSVGPLQYRVEHQRVGVSGPKWSMAPRHLKKVNAEPPNKLVQPVDTHGVNTPGPSYRPNSSYWNRGPEKSFGSGWRVQPSQGPGPAEYKVNTTPRGPACTLAKRLPAPRQWQNAINDESPGPAAYKLGTTIGKAIAKSITGRPRAIEKDLGPAPNLYTLPDSLQDPRNAATLNYGYMEPDVRPHPGPTKYSVTSVNLPKAAVYSISKSTRPCFPDILNYPLIARQQTTFPGPGTYEMSWNATSNDNPKFSMGMRAISAKNEVPGPNHYRMATATKPNCERAPAFSMGSRLHTIDKRVSPGPAAYNPQPQSSSGHSMTKRPKSTKKFATPAPNAYNLEKGQTSSGVYTGPRASLKSRGSPYIYTGLTKF